VIAEVGEIMQHTAIALDHVREDLSPAASVMRIRLAQLLVNESLRKKEFRVPVHLALGHEAIAASVSAVMGEKDWLCLTHRNAHYNIARATSLKAELAELRLTPEGVAGGWLGSMNMANPARGIIYSSSILGNNLSVAAGVALAESVAATGGVVFATTGDGAMEEGSLYESLEFMKSARLANVVLIENNGWSMFTRISERRCVIRTDSLADAFGIPYERLTGNDPWRYIAALSRLRNIAIEQRSPVIVEIEVSTLGDVTLPAEGRHINYHHGVAPVTFSDWPLIKQDPSDPVHVLMERLGEPTAREIAGRIHASLLDEINS